MSQSDAISEVTAYEIFNFRGIPTVEAEVILTDGSRGRGAVAAGISAGSSEVHLLRDGDPKRFNGQGVLNAVRNVREIIRPALLGLPANQQETIDRKLLELDGTPEKSRLGGNATLAVSLAVARAAAASRRLPLYQYLAGDEPLALPVPCFDLFRGGAHGTDSVDLQEYLLIPAGLKTFSEALESGVRVYNELFKLLLERGFNVQPVGPLAAPLSSNLEPVKFMIEAIERAGYRLGDQCFVGIDAAMSELYQDGKYVLACEKRELTASELAGLWKEWVDNYPIISIEDAMSEEDWEGWQAVTQKIGERVQLVGDDLFTTNPKRVKKGIELEAANAVLVKPNQIGTLSETMETMTLAHQAGWGVMLSTRSGETEDTVVSDLSVLTQSGQIKTGPVNGASVVKHNQLLRIEQELGKKATYKGKEAFKRYAGISI